ncbi:MAG: peptidylprolyl isomerase [Planctomycetota bacterium]|nr:peptidylprolyl isomerase [Planctomycetota bacterium]
MSSSADTVAAMRGAIAALKEAGEIDTSSGSWKTSLPKFPETSVASDAQLYWVIETNHGTVKIKLMPDVAPNHVRNTLYLSELGFYDDLIFHRVITGFMAQGGCPAGNGMGGPGYKFQGEFAPTARHDRKGLLSMANAGPGTDGSQFFLTFTPTPHLDDNHTIYGEVTEGQPVLEELEKRGSGGGATSEPLHMIKTTIEFDS